MKRIQLRNGGEATAPKLRNNLRKLKAVASLPFCMALGAACLPFVTCDAKGQDSEVHQSIEAVTANWKRFTSAEGRFSILFPGSPTISQETINHPIWKFELHKTQLRTFAEYGVMYADYPKGITDATSADVILDEGAKGAVAEVNSQLLSISPIVVAGYPGRLLKERMPNGTMMNVKMVLVGQRMYQIAITTPREDGVDPETVGFFGSVVKKFLDSFELMNATQDSTLTVGSCPPSLENCVTVTEEIITEGTQSAEAGVPTNGSRSTRFGNGCGPARNRRVGKCHLGCRS